MGLAGIVAGDAANDMNAEERRDSFERRNMSWRTVLYGFLRSRRRSTRRTEEPASLYGDWHHPWLFFLSVGIMLMSAADAFLTLRLLSYGATEANPLMHSLIYLDVSWFVGLKIIMTALSLMVLIYASRYRLFGRVRVGILVTFFFCAYLTLIVYELIGLMLLADVV